MVVAGVELDVGAGVVEVVGSADGVDIMTAVVVVVVLELVMVQVSSVTSRDIETTRDMTTIKNNLTQKQEENAHESETEADLVVGAQDVDEELVAAAEVDDVKTAVVDAVLELVIIQVASVTSRNIRKNQSKTRTEPE